MAIKFKKVTNRSQLHQGEQYYFSPNSDLTTDFSMITRFGTPLTKRMKYVEVAANPYNIEEIIYIFETVNENPAYPNISDEEIARFTIWTEDEVFSGNFYTAYKEVPFDGLLEESGDCDRECIDCPARNKCSEVDYGKGEW